MYIDAIKDSSLKSIAEKVLAGIPATTDDCGAMLKTHDIMGLGIIASYIKNKISGRKVFYGVNMNLNYTNICELRCPICAFSRDPGDEGAYTYTLDDVEKRVRAAAGQGGLDEVHIVGGLNPELKMEYFEEMLARIKSVDPRIHIVAFTAVEYDYFAKLNSITLDEVFQRLKAAGLGSIPGGGAEIFADDKRAVLAPKKISADKWLSVMERAHSHGIKTNATMLYNHVETMDDIVDHLNRVRELQYRTGGFKTFVPLLFHPGQTGIEPSGPFNSGFGDIRIYAASRIFLHNVPHIKALWMYLGEKMAQIMLNFGADDIGATYVNEKVVHSAGAKTPDFGREDDLISLIENAGYIPVRTSADYSGERS